MYNILYMGVYYMYNIVIWVWFAINPLKVRACLIIYLIICNLSGRNFVSFAHFLNWIFTDSKYLYTKDIKSLSHMLEIFS